MILVKALVYSHQILTIRELFDSLMLLILVIFQTDSTSTAEGVIVLGENVSDEFISIV